LTKTSLIVYDIGEYKQANVGSKLD